MSSELEVLKQRITELEAENAELRKVNTEIRDLRFKLSVSDAEIAELKRRNAEALRANAEHNERRDTKVKKLEQKNAELEARLAIVEQGSLVALQNDKETIAEMLPEVAVSDVDLPNAVVNQRNNVDTRTSEEREKKVQDKMIAKD